VRTETNGRLIEEEADKRLQQSLYPELRRVLCNYRRGILTLYGVVSSFHVRQIAQELVQGLEGIEIIDNQLVVAEKKASPNSSDEGMSDGAGSTGAEDPEKPMKSETRNPKSRRKQPTSQS
jgi:osmotically-inducible protein OsmY